MRHHNASPPATQRAGASEHQKVGRQTDAGRTWRGTVQIVGLDLQADGGTHVSHTGEIGRVRVTGYESKGRINKRIRIAVEDAV